MKFFRKRRTPKIFCIGHNKTGTTTIESVLKDFGYKLGNQVQGELLLDAWYHRDFKEIIKFCKTADAFQDVPFSLPYTYQHLDLAYPGAKFILTERDNAEQWYQSLTKFHSKLWAKENRIPNMIDLKSVKGRYKDFAYQYIKYNFQTLDNDLYNKEVLIDHYLRHNDTVKSYFKSRPEKLRVINVSKSEDYATLCQFLDKPITRTDFPWENKT